MDNTRHMDIVLRLPGTSYEESTAPYNRFLKSYVDRMDKTLASDTGLAGAQVFRDYAVYCRWPIRQLEYSFAIRHLPDEPNGTLLDVGSGVTPWPYFVADRGWPTISIDPEVDQVATMKRHGQEVFVSSVDHRVGDARGLGFVSGTFAAVTCISVLEHLQHADVPLALAEIVRVCRPGGRIILTTDIYAADDATIPVGYGAFAPTTLARIFGPLARACGATAEFASLLEAHNRLSIQNLEAFWTQHWEPGLWQEQNRGYGAVGMVFDLPDSPEACRVLIDTLRNTALQMEFPPPGTSYHQVRTRDGMLLWMIKDDALSQAITLHQFEHDLHSFIEHLLRPGDIVFDVGAHVGLYTQLIARLVGPDGLVYAFEPAEQTFGCLTRNTATADNVRLNRIGLSHANGPLTLRLGSHGNASMNSFGEPFGLGADSAGQYDLETTWVTTLDSYMIDYAVRKLDVLKIDVEGWEEHVLRGGIATLLERSPVLLLEYCTPAARNAQGSCAATSYLAKSLGYDLFRYHPDTRELELIEPNRDIWIFSNLIAIKPAVLPQVLERIQDRRMPPAAVTLGGHHGRDSLSVNPSAALDITVILEENRSLHRRLVAGILDQEVTALFQQTHLLKADSETKNAVIERLLADLAAVRADQGAKAGVIERLLADLAAVRADLAAVRADQGAKAGVIERLLADLAAVRADQAAKEVVITQLDTQLRAKEAAITQLGSELSEYKRFGFGLTTVGIRGKRKLRQIVRPQPVLHMDAPPATVLRSPVRQPSATHVALDVMQIQFGISGGVEVYMKTLVRALAPQTDQAYLTLLCTPDQVPHLQELFGTTVSYHAFDHERAVSFFVDTKRKLSRSARVPAAAYANTSFAHLKTKLGIDLLHSPVQIFSQIDFTVPGILNMHDLQHLHYPENFTPADLEARQRLYGQSAALASTVIASSDFVRRDIVEHLHIPASKVVTIPVACNPDVERGLQTFSPAQARQQYNLPETFGFYPAQFWAHKNHARLVEALAIVRTRAPQHDFKLVFTGYRGHSGWPLVERTLDRLGLREHVLLLDFIPTEHLGAIYQLATFCVMPSLFEASSYPVIEAQTLGCPAMCSNITSLPELMADEAGLLFDPFSAEDMANQMLRWLNHPAERHAYAERGRRRALRDHSIEVYAASILELYRAIRRG